MGVAQYLQEQIADLERSPLYASGTGCFPALCVLLGEDPERLMLKHFEGVFQAMENSPLCGYCDQMGALRDFLWVWLPKDAHVVAYGRLHILVSPWPLLGLRFLSRFGSKQELIDAVIASCSFPGVAAMPKTSCHEGWQGCWYSAELMTQLTPIDRLVSVPIRVLPRPPCDKLAWAANLNLETLFDDDLVPWNREPTRQSLTAMGKAVHPGLVPVNLAYAYFLMKAAKTDARRYFAEYPWPETEPSTSMPRWRPLNPMPHLGVTEQGPAADQRTVFPETSHMERL
eukprot:CAMPEP_0172610008 /NCGR_PEP_ID=MMETSP1068-20121228/29886_1 /TAXON_ID=35684 /ORGANISM="Pseudopedinella elastica, Strain CCMP716" /LENGTH=284 /DNA_ID=CAMNT_0013413633 /DNA_START=381 /DNA_END=1235 /DNA_ORIENTATION=-